MKNRVLLILFCCALVLSCETEEDTNDEVQNNVGSIQINNTISDIHSGIINRSTQGYGGFKFELALTSAEVTESENGFILQDSIFSMIGFEIYTDSPSLKSGDYVVQLNEDILNTVYSSYYIDYYEIGEEVEEVIAVDAGVLSIINAETYYEIEFKGMDFLNNRFDVYYTGELLIDYDF